jgi:hypothetical protein
MQIGFQKELFKALFQNMKRIFHNVSASRLYVCYKVLHEQCDEHCSIAYAKSLTKEQGITLVNNQIRLNVLFISIEMKHYFVHSLHIQTRKV